MDLTIDNRGNVMINDDLLIKATIFGAIVGLSVGVRGILNRDTENIYKAINMLIFGTTMILFLIFEFYCQSLKNRISLSLYNDVKIAGAIIVFFASGIYGVVNKNRINDPVSFQFSRMAVAFSIMYTLGMGLFWLRWHHF